MVKIELLSENNFNEYSLDSYVRKRQVAKAISSDEYVSYIALDDDAVIGFIGLKRRLNNDYMILDMMHVSAACRGTGIGRKIKIRSTNQI
ncbi:MAG: GNAT family N-acetyltransferase [Coprococcus sp.]